MRSRNKKGFTLLEVIIVVIILAILASIALPRIISSIAFTRSAEALQTIAAIRTGMEQCYLLNNNSFATCGALSAAGVTFVGKYFSAPTFVVAAGTYSVIFNAVGSVADNIIYTSANQSIVGAGVFNRIHQ